MKNNSLKLYSNLDKVDFIEELHQRKIKFFQNQTKGSLEKLLVKEMQCGPALLFYNDDMEIIRSYEVLANEPMHDIDGHLRNLIEELTYHLNKEEKQLFHGLVPVVLNKESKRAVDYRKSVIYLCIHLQGKININVYNILLTVCYMQEILYGAEKDRNMLRIFRYHILCYVHTYLLIDFLGKKLKALTKRKMFEKYFHSI